MAMDGIKSLVSSPVKIFYASPNDSLGSALEHVKSSHEPIFVDINGKLGIVSASHALFKRRYPLKTKITTATITPPHITINTSLFDVAREMLSTRLYILPVFDSKKKMIGIISARRILRSILKSGIIPVMKNTLEIDHLLTAKMRSKIGEIYKKMKEEQRSRVAVVDDKKKLVGIITRRDIQEAFITPSRRMRFRKHNGGNQFDSKSFDEEEITRFEYPVEEFYRVNVVALPNAVSIQEIIQTLLSKKVNSVVLVDNKMIPKGIISIRSFLKALVDFKPGDLVEIKISDKNSSLTNNGKRKLEKQLGRFVDRIQKREPIRYVEMTVDSYKNINRKKTGYEIHLRLHCLSGKGFLTKVENKDLLTGVQEAVGKIEHQLK